ncbi:MAG TPA: MFS transporter [Acidimicrobiales bacterium]|nr:MFS transporter [Acidimicrobiales bacterium]
MPPSSLRPFRHRDFRLLWSASAFSSIGTWMQAVAVGAYVTQETGQARWTALVAVAAFLPIGLLTPVGGALADRLDRRKWMAAGVAVEALLAALLTVLSATGRASPGAVTAVVFANGCIAAIVLPFYQAMIPDLVSKDDLLGAAALGSAQYNLGRVLGPALAAVLVAATSYSWAFAVNTVSFFAVIAALLLIRLPDTRAPADGLGIVARVRAGARAAWAEPGCRTPLILIAVVAFLLAPFIALIPAKAHELVGGGLKDTAAATGVLTTAQGIGAVVGALLIAPLADRFGRRRLIAGFIVVSSLAIAVYGVMPSVPLAAAALVVVGGSYIGILSGMNTVVQLRAPAEFRGRILSLYFMGLGSIYPIGGLLQGALADRVGLATTVVAFAAAMLVVLAFIWTTRPHLLHALNDPPRPEVGIDAAAVAEDVAVAPEVRTV